MMHPVGSIPLMLAALLFAGCQQPSEINLKPADDGTNLEVFPVAQVDTTFATASVDSSGILPEEQIRFGGLFTATHVRYDLGDGHPTSYSYSRVFVADSVVRLNNSFAGFRGRDIGPVLLNGKLMLKIDHRLISALSGRRDTLRSGVEYVANLGGEFLRQYTWKANPLLIGAIDETITAPDTIVLQSPRAGSAIPREKELILQWKAGGGGGMKVIVSRYAELRRSFVPLLEFRMKVNAGTATVPPKILKQFPVGLYMLTFIQANRRQEVVVDQYSGRLTLQAASIYNCLVGLQ
jgi:hypothetical protein